MDADAYDTLLTVYGVVCIIFASIILSTADLKFESNPKTFSFASDGSLGFIILTVSGIVALTESSTYYDWLLTVPLIYVSFSIAVSNQKAEQPMINLAGWSFLTILAAIAIEGFDYSFEQKAGIMIPIAIVFGWFYFQAIRNDALSSLTGFEQFNFILILAYPILWFSAGMTISDSSQFDGSLLDMIGLSFYDYLASFVVLSVFCKLLLSLYHHVPEGN